MYINLAEVLYTFIFLQVFQKVSFKFHSCAKVKHVKEGGNNTKYFHLIANGKHRRKKIFQVEHDKGVIIDEHNL
jgi:hypothetical protein